MPVYISCFQSCPIFSDNSVSNQIHNFEDLNFDLNRRRKVFTAKPLVIIEVLSFEGTSAFASAVQHPRKLHWKKFWNF